MTALAVIVSFYLRFGAGQFEERVPRPLVLIVGISAFLLEGLDTSIRDVHEVEALLQVPMLGLVPARSAMWMMAGSVCPSGKKYR